MAKEHQCCKLINLVSQETIDRILSSGARYMPNHDDPIGDGKYAYDMENKDGGYPCVHLTESGCNIHEIKPAVCMTFPKKAKHVSGCDTCSYSFDAEGIRTGTCNGCEV